MKFIIKKVRVKDGENCQQSLQEVFRDVLQNRRIDFFLNNKTRTIKGKLERILEQRKNESQYSVVRDMRWLLENLIGIKIVSVSKPEMCFCSWVLTR